MHPEDGKTGFPNHGAANRLMTLVANGISKPPHPRFLSDHLQRIDGK